jgi:hypothetical protein
MKISITKYNPIFRNDLGHFTRDEWISYSDIGREYDGIILSKEEYLRVENLYINAVFVILEHFNADSILVSHIFKGSETKPEPERFHRYNDFDLYDSFIKLEKGNHLNIKEDISDILKLRLREYILELELIIDGIPGTEIHFGFDYYMYLKTNKGVKRLTKKIDNLGLFSF